LQASITQQSTGFLAMKAAASRVDQRERYKECRSICELATAQGKTLTAPLAVAEFIGAPSQTQIWLILNKMTKLKKTDLSVGQQRNCY
jgi:hypothetical protein